MKLSESQTAALYTSSDSDGDGKVTLAEFRAATKLAVGRRRDNHAAMTAASAAAARAASEERGRKATAEREKELGRDKVVLSAAEVLQHKREVAEAWDAVLKFMTSKVGAGCWVLMYWRSCACLAVSRHTTREPHFSAHSTADHLTSLYTGYHNSGR